MGTGAGIAATVIAVVVLIVLLLVSTPRIVVTDRALAVGRAQIEREYVGDVIPFRGEDAVQERGPRLNATAYLCLRGWIPNVVKIEITDEADLTPYWLASTRHPERLAEALATR